MYREVLIKSVSKIVTDILFWFISWNIYHQAGSFSSLLHIKYKYFLNCHMVWKTVGLKKKKEKKRKKERKEKQRSCWYLTDNSFIANCKNLPLKCLCITDLWTSDTFALLVRHYISNWHKCTYSLYVSNGQMHKLLWKEGHEPLFNYNHHLNNFHT